MQEANQKLFAYVQKDEEKNKQWKNTIHIHYGESGK